MLWGACPMVTLPLERMASRVAASLCYATGLGSEMVVSCQVGAFLQLAWASVVAGGGLGSSHTAASCGGRCVCGS